MKQIKLNNDARYRILDGMLQSEALIKQTLGPKASSVAISKTYGAPSILDDGISIIKQITLKDEFANMGVRILQEASFKTNQTAGDGSSTTVLLTASMAKIGMKYLTAGIPGISIKRGMDVAAKEIESYISKFSREINSIEDLNNVATVSCNNATIGKLISDTMFKLGKDGVITVEDSNTLGITATTINGLKIDKGYASIYLMDDIEKGTAELRDVKILVTDQKIDNINQIIDLLEALNKSDIKKLVIVADDFSEEVLNILVMNKIKGVFSTMPIKAPGFASEKDYLLQDLAITVGATVISGKANMQLNTVSIDQLGRAERVVVTDKDTVFVGGAGDVDKIKERCSSISEKIATMQNGYEKTQTEQRLSRLSGGVGVIYVCTPTETETTNTKYLVEDAINSTKLAYNGGIVAGGGCTLLACSTMLNGELNNENSPLYKLSDDEKIGVKILIESLKNPIKYIAENSGVNGEVVIQKIQDHSVQSDIQYYGFNAMDNTYGDMLAMGIIDATDVEKAVVKNSISSAGMFITIGGAIVDENVKDETKAVENMLGGI